MRSITNCPACQTQFVVTAEQLNQHNGTVRCGNCLNVFDATHQIVALDNKSESELAIVVSDVANDIVLAPPSLDEAQLNNGEAQLINDKFTVNMEATDVEANQINPALQMKAQPSSFADLADKSKLKPKHAPNKNRTWLVVLFALLLLLFALAQSIYFLRNEIAIYYPNTKPYLTRMCEPMACRIELPKKIEFIVIDDSDIQEDANHAGLMRFSSTLINQASFNQAYPNLELTLTDTDDKPKLRRIFKPSEYLVANTNIANGLGAGEEIKVKLAITTQGETVAGYRVFVTY